MAVGGPFFFSSLFWTSPALRAARPQRLRAAIGDSLPSANGPEKGDFRGDEAELDWMIRS